MIKLKKILEVADNFYLPNGKHINFYTDDNRAFAYKNGELKVADDGQTHGEAFIRFGVQYPGRIWLKLKIISFWEYPETYQKLEVVIKDLNNEDFEIDDSWKIEFPFPEGRKPSLFVQINDSKLYNIAVKSVKAAKEYIDSEHERHVQSPLKKKKIDVPSGLGSKKIHEPEWMQPAYEGKNNFSKTK